MEVLVSPISGPLFAAQLASLYKLTSFGYKPKLCFVGSGGGVAVFAAKAAYWNPSKIFSVASMLSTSCFVSEWMTSQVKILPSALGSIINGSMYKSTREGVQVLSEHLSQSTVQDVEVWIAAINEKTGCVLLSCNTKRDNALIKGEKLNAQLFEYESLAYLGGNLEEISKAILASACIPVLVEPMVIRGHKYVDCGVKYGSSFTPMFREVLEMSRKEGVHITYLSGRDLSKPPKMCGKINEDQIGLFDHIKLASSHAVNSHVEYDRNMAYMIVQLDSEDEPWYREFPIEDLDHVLERRKMARCSLVELYPKKECKLDLFAFTPEQLRAVILEYNEILSIRVWWSGDHNCL
jgi:hypothetical protein